MDYLTFATLTLMLATAFALGGMMFYKVGYERGRHGQTASLFAEAAGKALPPATLARAAATAGRLRGDRRAVTSLEYGIIAGVLGLGLITVFGHFGSTLHNLFTTIGKSI